MSLSVSIESLEMSCVDLRQLVDISAPSYNQEAQAFMLSKEQLEELQERLGNIENFEDKLAEANKNATLRAASAEEAKRKLLEKEVEIYRIREECTQKTEELKSLEERAAKLEAELQEAANTEPVVVEVVKEVVVEKEVESKAQTADDDGQVQDSTTDREDTKPDTTEPVTEEKTMSDLNPLPDTGEELNLDDEEFWSNLPKGQIPARFQQYRHLSRDKVKGLQGQLETVVKKTKRKIDILKGQFHEHKRHWELERQVLVEQVKHVQELHTEAEEEADKAMTQLEQLIDEQEKMEEEEERKRRDLEERKREATLMEDEAKQHLQEKIHKLEALVEEKSKEEKTEAIEEDKESLKEPSAVEQDTKVTQEVDPQDAQVQTNVLQVADVGVNALVKMLEQAVQTMPEEQQQVLESISTMITNEASLGEDQTNALNLLRAVLLTSDAQVQTDEQPSEETLRAVKVRSMTMYTLASHLSHESTRLGVEPSSVFKTFASLFSQPQKTEKSSEDKATTGVSDQLLREISADISTAAKRISTSLSRMDLTRFPTQATMGSDTVGLVETPFDVRQHSKAVSALHFNVPRTDVGVQYSPMPDAELKSDTRPTSQLSHRSASEKRESLNELRRSADLRRSRTPTSIPGSCLDDMELNENKDAPFPPERLEIEQRDFGTSCSIPSLYDVATSVKAPSVCEMATSPHYPDGEDGFGLPPAIADHPIVKEFLRVYQGILAFKESLAGLFMDKEMTSYMQMLTDIEAVQFDAESTVIPQIENIAEKVLGIMDDVLSIVRSVLANDRDYPVSSLLGLSRDPTQSLLITREKTHSLVEILPMSSLDQKPRSAASASLREHIDELQLKCQALQEKLQEQSRDHEDQQKHNTVMMMEMQDTIHQLRQELITIQKQSPQQQLPQSPPPVMFTNHDANRNAKVLKKAVSRKRLEPEKYENAVEAMNRYVSIPAKRLVHLVNKYAHHKQMRKIEDKLRDSAAVDDRVIHLLDKMETLQNERAQRWADEMDNLSQDRLQLANYLMLTLDDIEQETGIFLIKPMFSYKSRVAPGVFARKPVQASRREMGSSAAAVSPVPTPIAASRNGPELSSKLAFQISKSSTDTWGKGIEGKRPRQLTQTSQPTWMPSYSSQSASALKHIYQTPRILELDVNRMLLSQNQISLSIPPSFQSRDRLVNAANQSTRTFATLTRPFGGELREQSTKSIAESHNDHFVPPTTPSAVVESPRRSANNSRNSKVSPPHSGAANSRQSKYSDDQRDSLATPPLPPINQTLVS